MTVTNYFSFKAAAIVAFFGQGDSIYIAAGSATLVNVNFRIYDAIGYALPNTSAVYVGAPVFLTPVDPNATSPVFRPVYVRMGGEQVFLDRDRPSRLAMRGVTFRDRLSPSDMQRLPPIMRDNVPEFDAMFDGLTLERSSMNLQPVRVDTPVEQCTICALDAREYYLSFQHTSLPRVVVFHLRSFPHTSLPRVAVVHPTHLSACSVSPSPA